MTPGIPKYSKIIIIDDSEMDNMLNRMILEVSNYSEKISTFNCPTEALDSLRIAKGKDIPELIFLDINMPAMDGFEFMEEFEKLPPQISSFTKVIIVSSSDDPIDLQKASKYQSIIKYLKKPLNKGEL